MNKNLKFLNKLNPKERELVTKTIEEIVYGKVTARDVKKLKNHADVFRVRIGRIRIVYYKKGNTLGRTLFVGFRDERTYREF